MQPEVFYFLEFRCQKHSGALCGRTPPLGPQSQRLHPLHSFNATRLCWRDPTGSTSHDRGSCKTLLTRHRGPRLAPDSRAIPTRTPRLSSLKCEPTACGSPRGGFPAPDSVSDGPVLQLLASSEWASALMRSLASNRARGQRSFWAIHF